MCQGWSTPYIGDELIPPRVLMGIQNSTMRLMTIPFGPQHIYLSWRILWNHDPMTHHFQAHNFCLGLLTLQGRDSPMWHSETRKEGRITRSCFWLPFFSSKVFKSLPAILGMAKMCQRFKKLVPNLSSYISGWWFQANLKNTPRNGSSLERPGQK